MTTLLLKSRFSLSSAVLGGAMLLASSACDVEVMTPDEEYLTETRDALDQRAEQVEDLAESTAPTRSTPLASTPEQLISEQETSAFAPDCVMAPGEYCTDECNFDYCNCLSFGFTILNICDIAALSGTEQQFQECMDIYDSYIQACDDEYATCTFQCPFA